MKYNKKSIENIDVAGKKVLVRCDFNVPQDENLNITDETRILGALPTIKYLVAQGAKVILCSHMGRPHNVLNEKLELSKKDKKKVEELPVEEQEAAKAAILEKAKKDIKKLSLKAVADNLAAKGFKVTLAADVIGPDAQAKVAALKEGEIVILENVRFHKEEEKNDPAFAKALASLADVYVNDAFGTAHRAHASTAGVADYLPAVCGYLIEKEISIMGKALEDPQRPFVAILGGAKVSDKIGVINNLLEKVDTIIIGGAMAYTFAKAMGGNIGMSRCEDDKLDYAKEMIEKAKAKGVNFLLPVDSIAADKFDENATPVVVDTNNIPENLMGLDIGPKAIEMYAAAVKDAGTVVWNGPMGVFEWDAFANGTRSVARAIAESNAISIIGGGDSAAAVEQLGFADKMSHISTGGGASLEFLEGLTLPGIACLQDK